MVDELFYLPGEVPAVNRVPGGGEKPLPGALSRRVFLPPMLLTLVCRGNIIGLSFKEG